MSYVKGGTISTRVTVIAVCAALYAVAKGLTAFIPTPWGVGQLLLGIFVPAFFAVVSETVPAAVGAALGMFLGDTLFLTPLGLTTPVLSLAAGVPANFVAFLLFGWLVKRYGSWPSFITSSVGTITLGNFLAAILVVIFGPFVIPYLGTLSTLAKFELATGLTVFWTTTMVPAMMIALPPLIRAVRPLVGRSGLISYYPSWSNYEVKNLLPTSLIYALAFALVGALFFSVPEIFANVLNSGQIAMIRIFLFVTAASLAIIGPIVGIIAGSKKLVTKSAG
jgi:hypothetical protein